MKQLHACILDSTADHNVLWAQQNHSKWTLLCVCSILKAFEGCNAFMCGLSPVTNRPIDLFWGYMRSRLYIYTKVVFKLWMDLDLLIPPDTAVPVEPSDYPSFWVLDCVAGHELGDASATAIDWCFQSSASATLLNAMRALSSGDAQSTHPRKDEPFIPTLESLYTVALHNQY